MTTANDKGLLLEEGVRIIERCILQAESRIKESELAIESRKIITHLGVRHEIDLYVCIAGARGYDAVFIFECKNWKDKIGKNEIIVFSEKLRVSAAQRGFFIATGFTEDAVAQAAQDPRIELVWALTQELAQVEYLTCYHFLTRESLDTSMDLFEASASQTGRVAVPIDFDTATATLASKPIDLRTYVLEWQNEALKRRTDEWHPPLPPADEYQLIAEEDRTFLDRPLVVNGRDYTLAKLRVVILVRVVSPRVRARVDVHGRGSALQFEPVKLGEGRLQIWLACSLPPSGPST